MINSDLTLSVLNNSVAQAEIESAKKYNLDLSIVKFEIKEQDLQKLSKIIKFIYGYMDFKPMVSDSLTTYVVFMHNMKLHATVLMVKNLNLALKLNFATKLGAVGVTCLDSDDDVQTVTNRLDTFWTKSKLTKQDVFYGTSKIDSTVENTSILDKLEDKNINIYGLYNEAPIKIKSKISKVGDDFAVFKVPRIYLSFLQKQAIVYLEHHSLPDIFSASVLKVDYENETLEVGNIKFIDHSPIHRKNLRVTPISTVKSTLNYKDFVISGFIFDISTSSVLFTTELHNIDELKKDDLVNKTFEISFQLEIFNNTFDISAKSTIFKINGNQLVLNIFTNSDTQKVINEYINMCYQQLLLQVQGKVV